MIARLQAAATSLLVCTTAREFGKAVREVMALADRSNEYVDAHKPWELAKLADKQRTAPGLQHLHRGLPPAHALR